MSAGEGQRPRNYLSCSSSCWIFHLIYALSTSTTMLPQPRASFFQFQLIYPSICLSINQFVYQSINLFIYQWICLSINESVYQSIFMSMCQSNCKSIYHYLLIYDYFRVVAISWNFFMTLIPLLLTSIFQWRSLKRFLKHHYHPNGFYWGHQCSWTPTPANSMQVWRLQEEVTRPKASEA